jgi:hypothetical protein
MVKIGNWIPTLLHSHRLNIWIYTVNRYKYKCFEEKGDKWFKISLMFLSKSHWLKRNLMYAFTNYVGLRIQLAIMTKIYDWKKIYRITAVLKVKTDIIASITASQTGGAVILVIMYVEIFKTDVIVLIGDVKTCLTSHWPIIFNIKVSSFAC